MDDITKIRRVTFTGSHRVGRVIAKHCAENLKQYVLEVGDNAPVVILDNTNIEETAESVLFGGMTNASQICMSTTRVIVENSMADRFVSVL